MKKYLKDDEKLMTAFCSHIATGVSVCINKSSTKHELNNSVNDLKLLESKFNEYKEIGNQLGFKHFESSALVRSSYRARKHVN